MKLSIHQVQHVINHTSFVIKMILMSQLIIGCRHNATKNYILPDFETNKSISEISKSIRNITDEKDFAVVYTIIPGDMNLEVYPIKMFCLKDSTWEKIEIRRGIIELDSLYTQGDPDVVEKDIILKKVCRKIEGESFLKKLTTYNLFTMQEEFQLKKRCEEIRTDNKVPEYTDLGFSSFYIIHGSNVRNLTYQLYNREEDCPSMTEWEDIEKIISLYEDEWYSKNH